MICEHNDYTGNQPSVAAWLPKSTYMAVEEIGWLVVIAQRSVYSATKSGVSINSNMFNETAGWAIQIV